MAAQKMLLEPGGGWAHHRRLGTKRELPPWYEGYPYIEGGYRLGYDCADCARSVFRLHNETLNIWTHGVGLVAWVYASARLLNAEPLRSADDLTRRAHVLLYAACALMPLLSAAAHAFHCRGPRVSRLAWKLDFAGIACLLGARAALEGYLLLYCRRDLLAVWTAVASITFGGFGFAAVYFYVPDALAPLFVLLHAPLAAFAVTEWPALPRSARADARAAAGLLLAGSLSGVAGFVVRAARVPERWVPRRREFSVFCDIVGASHQWWHVLTMVGPLLAQQGNARLLAFRYAEGSVCPAY